MTLLVKACRRRTISWSNSVLTDDPGHITMIIGTGIDTTERQLLESRLAQAERLDSIGRVSAGTAHDFNNTLGTLQMRVGPERSRTRKRQSPRPCRDEQNGRTNESDHCPTDGVWLHTTGQSHPRRCQRRVRTNLIFDPYSPQATRTRYRSRVRLHTWHEQPVRWRNHRRQHSRSRNNLHNLAAARP